MTLFCPTTLSRFVLAITVTAPCILFAADGNTPDQKPAEVSQHSPAQSSAAPTQAADPKSGIDPALVGLPGFPVDPSSPEDFKEALSKVAARIAKLSQPDSAQRSLAAGEKPDADPRAEPLQALQQALQKRAALVARHRDLEDALAELQKQRETLTRDGLGKPAPYSISLLDQLSAESRLSEHAAEAADRAVDVAQRQIDISADAFKQRDQRRRLLRDRMEQQQSEPQPDQENLARQLEAARLATLAAAQRQAAAQLQLQVAEQERDLEKGRQELLSMKIDRVKGRVVFTKEALDERLTELKGRETAFRKRLETLTRASDAAEIALFDARRQLKEATSESRMQFLQARVAAREAEFNAARSGAAYLRHALSGIASARTLWERRYQLRQDGERASLSSWLDETQDILAKTDEETRYIQAEIATLRSMKLTVAQRLDTPDLAPEIRQALERHKAAIDDQETDAEELLTFEDQLRELAQRLDQELEPLVRHRSLQQRFSEVQSYLTGLWSTELFVFQDQGFYLRDIVTGGAVFVLVLFAISLLKQFLRRTVLPRLVGNGSSEKRAPQALVLALVRNTSQLFVIVLAFYTAMSVSGLAQGRIQEWLWSGLAVLFWLQIGIWASAGAVDYLNRQRSRREQLDPSAVSGYGLILFFIRVGIWSVVLISVLTHFNYPVTGLIGALGVGGIAVAFAVQNILADIFNSMAIILDKPFRVGDFVVTGDTMGMIEQIGVKTTRIRSLSGEQVTMSNTDLLNSRIHNYKRMAERRVLFKLGVVYQTPPELLEQIPRMIEEIIRAQDHTRFDRAHFFEYGDFALSFEIVYFVLGPDYNRYMDIQQAINLAINRRFRDAGIDFAYPTQEVILRKAADAPMPNAR